MLHYCVRVGPARTGSAEDQPPRWAVVFDQPFHTRGDDGTDDDDGAGTKLPPWCAV